MNSELELKLQAYLDGELSRWQARKVAAWLAADREAQGLLNELTMAKTALAAGEVELKLPENQEFYWNKIQRDIASSEAAHRLPPPPALVFLAAWRRLLAPLAGVALITFLTVYSFRMYDAGDDAQ